MAERREGGEEGKQMAADRHHILSATSRVHALFLLLELPKKKASPVQGWPYSG